MFQPTSASYILATIEATIDRHMGETEEEQAQRESRPYSEHRFLLGARGLLAVLGHVVASIGEPRTHADVQSPAWPGERATSR